MEHISEQELILKYNRVYGQVIRQERRKRKLSLEELSSGILSRTALDKVEKGKTKWTKLTGDTLMLRMGVLPEYFESLSSGDELDRWRMREDICLLVPGKPEAAEKKLKEYREKYTKREPLEERFLLKAEVMLMLSHVEAKLRNTLHQGQKIQEQARIKNETAVLLDKARQAADCTIQGDWEQYLAKCRLSPGELEAVLLVSAALFLDGSEDRAWALWQSVWEYPQANNWKERAMVMILPQAAALGLRQACASGKPAGSPVMPGLPGESIGAGDGKLWKCCAETAATAMYCLCWMPCAGWMQWLSGCRAIWNRPGNFGICSG